MRYQSSISKRRASKSFKSEYNSVILAKLTGITCDILDSISSQDKWATYDPYDIKASKLYLGSFNQYHGIDKIIARSLHWAGLLLPIMTRKILAIERTVTASGVAYLLQGVCRLLVTNFQPRQNSQPLITIVDQALANLEELRTDSKGWGLPFPWGTSNSLIIPKNSSLLYTTYSVLDALMDYYDMSRAAKVRDFILESIDALLIELNHIQVPIGVALSYSKFDRYQTINTNALFAGLLCRIRNRMQLNDYDELVDSLVTFVCNSQDHSGRWNYFAPSYTTNSPTDNYHTAMTLQGLCNVAKNIDNRRKTRDMALIALRKGTRFYLENFIDKNGKPRLWINRRIPIDIACCAEGIELLFRHRETLEELNMELEPKRMRLLEWTIKNMMVAKGEFALRAYGPHKIRLGSLRWGQAMMLRSLASAIMDLSR